LAARYDIGLLPNLAPSHRKNALDTENLGNSATWGQGLTCIVNIERRQLATHEVDQPQRFAVCDNVPKRLIANLWCGARGRIFFMLGSFTIEGASGQPDNPATSTSAESPIFERHVMCLMGD
jgi:hypothetical protein